jgi:NitT/TauT family transport system ATP-binding protein
MDPSNHSELRLDHLFVRYDGLAAVRDFSMALRDETIVLFGPSGCGKTSILKAILGVSDPKMKLEGAVRLNEQPVVAGDGTIGMVFQGGVIPGWMTAFDVCRMGCRIRMLSKAEQRVRVLEVFERFGISHMIDQFPHRMSGGEKQRVALAAALVNEPKVLLLDEPTTFLDGIARSAMWEFIETVIRPLGVPTIIVSHDPIEAVTLADRIFVLDTPARIRTEVSVSLPHPRKAEVLKHPDFWNICERIGGRPDVRVHHAGGRKY